MEEERKIVEVRRRGGKFELIGTVLILSSIVGCFSGGVGAFSWILCLVGLVVFVYGRCQ